MALTYTAVHLELRLALRRKSRTRPACRWVHADECLAQSENSGVSPSCQKPPNCTTTLGTNCAALSEQAQRIPRRLARTVVGGFSFVTVCRGFLRCLVCSPRAAFGQRC